MASTNFRHNGSSDIWSFRVEVSENSVSGNYRNISLTLSVRAVDYNGTRSGGIDAFYCKVGGTTVASKSHVGMDMPGSDDSRYVIYSGSFDVYVAPGNTKASIDLYLNMHFYSSKAGNIYVEAGISEITGLSIASDVSISSALDTEIGSYCNISWVPQDSSFTYKLKFSIGNFAHTTDIIRPSKNTLYTYSSYLIPYDVAYELPSSDSGTMYVYLYQYNDYNATSQLGSAAVSTFTVSLSDDVVPTLDSLDVSIDNSYNEATKQWNIAIAGYTKVNISAKASGVYGSTIENFVISGGYSAAVVCSDGKSLDYTGGAITSSGNKQFVITCIDSRGRQSVSSTSDLINFLPYTEPDISKFKVDRNNNGQIIANAVWTYDSLNGKNTVSSTLQYKLTTADDWTTYSGWNPTSGADVVLSNFTPKDQESSYNFRVTITDSVGKSSDKDAFFSVTAVLLDFKAGGDGLGVGKICEGSGMEVSMDAVFFNEVYIGNRDTTLYDYINGLQKSEPYLKYMFSYMSNLIYPVGAVYISLSDVSPEVLFGGTWEQINDRFLLSAGEAYEAGDEGGESEVTLTIDEMPSHVHYDVRRMNGNGGSRSTGASQGDGTSTGETDPAGGGMPHNNMPPYMVVYMWKRVV